MTTPRSSCQEATAPTASSRQACLPEAWAGFVFDDTASWPATRASVWLARRPGAHEGASLFDGECTTITPPDSRPPILALGHRLTS